MNIVVNTLGRFQIANEQGSINDKNIRSDMLKKLLLYLLLHRDHPLTVQELCTALWHEDEIDNPSGALKNLMYRLRNLLKTELGDADYLLSKKGFYSWNSEISVIMDCEEFEKNLEEAKKTQREKEERLYYYENAIAMYGGDFMLSSTDVFWILTLSAYYHSMYITSVKEMAQLYLEQGKFHQMELVCAEALHYEALDEHLNILLVQSYMRQNKQAQAKEAFEKVEKILYDQLGVRNTPLLTELGRELINMNNGENLSDINEMSSEITEKSVDGAYLCGYTVFREIYHLEARKIKRLGMSEYLVLFTIAMDAKISSKIGKEAIKDNMQKAMNMLERVLCDTLRIGDVVSRYSSTQYVVMLNSCNYENCALVANRVLSRFYQVSSKIKGLQVHMDIEEVVAASTIVK